MNVHKYEVWGQVIHQPLSFGICRGLTLSEANLMVVSLLSTNPNFIYWYQEGFEDV